MEFDPIPNGATLNLASLPSRLNIRANATSEVDSVRFTYDGTDRIENEPPYALGGDTNGVYRPFTFTPTTGAPHVLTATPFSGNGASGLGGVPLTIRFNVTSN